MGAQSTKKFIKNVAGLLTEEFALTTSTGVPDAQSIPALNANGILDLTILNAKVTSAGAGDSGKLPALDGTGRLDASFMPIAVGADIAIIIASEALLAGAFVNVWNNAGVVNVRNSDSTAVGKEAQGFVLSAVAINGNATVYFEGSNTAVTGKTGGKQYLSTAGTSSSTAPVASGNIVQICGFATSSTVVNFQSGTPLLLA